MRPLRALLPTLRRQPLAALAREAVWRLWKPYRSASYLAAIRRGEPSLRFRPVPYYQPNLSDVGDGANAIVGFADQICTGRFPFLGYETAELGFPPRWNVDFVTGFEWEHLPVAQVQPVVRHNGSDVKVPWELSRLQFLPVLAKAYLLTRKPQYREAAKELFSDWHARNPVGIGVNWTMAMGTNKLIGTDPERLLHTALEILDGGNLFASRQAPARPPLWDGKTAPRIVEILRAYWQNDHFCAEKNFVVS